MFPWNCRKVGVVFLVWKWSELNQLMTPANSYHTFPNTSNTPQKNILEGVEWVEPIGEWFHIKQSWPCQRRPSVGLCALPPAGNFFCKQLFGCFSKLSGIISTDLGLRGYTHKQLCLVRKLQVILCPFQGWWPTRWGLWPHLIQLQRVFFWRYGILQTRWCAHIFCFKASLLHIQIKTSINTKINKYTYTYIYIYKTYISEQIKHICT